MKFGNPPGGRGGVSPLGLKGAGIRGNNPDVNGSGNGSRGVGLPSREKMSWFEAACL